MTKYLDYLDVFLFDLIMELHKNTGINKYVIKLIKDKQLFYKPIYSLRLIKLENLKTYIETHLKTGFIWLSKSLIGTLILFHQILDKNLCLYINNQGINHLIIKN